MHLFIAVPSRSGRMLAQAAQELFVFGAAHAGALCSRTTFCIVANNPVIHDARNAAIAQFIESEATHLLFIDDDILFDAEALAQLVQSADGRSMVVGNYAKRSTSGGCTIVVLATALSADEFGFIEVASAGLGFAIIHRHAIEDIESSSPPYTLHNQERRAWCEAGVVDGQFVGDDEALCRKIRAAGHRIFCNLNIQLKHVGDYGY